MSNIASRPVAGQDYPSTWAQFLDWFPDEAACGAYLERLRWPQGFVCPRCGEPGEAYPVSRRRLMCPQCRYQGTVTAGIIFDKTRTSLRSWFAAAWYITNQKQGVTALGLQRVLGVGSYQTAWMMLHRLRRATIRPGRERLSGIVEVDETIVGRSAANKRRVGKREKQLADQYNARRSLVAIAVEIKEPKGFGRIRLRRIPDTSEASLLPFVQDSIAPGSVVRTDGSWAYRTLPDNGYPRDMRIMVGADDPAHVALPAVHRVAALLKRWLLGTHQGSVKPYLIDAYLDEFILPFQPPRCALKGITVLSLTGTGGRDRTGHL